MSFISAFTNLIKENSIDEESVKSTIGAIVRKLNSVYYDEYDEKKHSVYAGSFGRGTAINASDIDFCFVLPQDVYDRYKGRKGNVQSQLLTEIKEKLQKRYPNSDIKSDGQVVDAFFKKRIIELVPVFKVNPGEDLLIYPDTHNNGSWKNTNPKAQKEEIDIFVTKFPIYRLICKIIRCWKLEQNVDISGIKIDMLVMDFLNRSAATYQNKRFSDIDIIELLKCFFDYISNSCPRFVKVIGDNEYIDIDSTCFSKKASKTYTKLAENSTCELWDNCINLFGKGFPSNPFYDNKNQSEQFINQLFPVRFKYNLYIDCDIASDGFRPKKLRELLKFITSSNKYVIHSSKSLDFYIEDCNVPEPYDIYWKVRNVGEEARKRNQIRGQINKGKKQHHERSVFHGPHYVECYIVKDGVCVAKARIDVPII